jgi:hypothetical protein
VALVVCQLSVADWPLSIVSGLAVNDAVGAGAGGGGGGGGAGLLPLWHAPRNRMAPSAKTRAIHLDVGCFIVSPLYELRVERAYFLPG